MTTYWSDGEGDLVYVNEDGSIVGVFKAEDNAPAFADYGDYLLPWDWRTI